MATGDRSLREQLDAEARGWPRVVAGSVFASPGYYVKGRAFAFWQAGGLVLKLPAELRAQALARPGVRRYTVPRGSALEWVFVPLDGATEGIILPLLRAACRFLGGELEGGE
jgi:hypothetical protein